jgi:hypothetical protein
MMASVWGVLKYMEGSISYTEVMSMPVSEYISVLRYIREEVASQQGDQDV